MVAGVSVTMHVLSIHQENRKCVFSKYVSDQWKHSKIKHFWVVPNIQCVGPISDPITFHMHIGIAMGKLVSIMRFKSQPELMKNQNCAPCQTAHMKVGARTDEFGNYYNVIIGGHYVVCDMRFWCDSTLKSGIYIYIINKAWKGQKPIQPQKSLHCIF